jgi:hypothetical protein
MNLTVEE